MTKIANKGFRGAFESKRLISNVRLPYHYCGILAPTGSGSQETFDLGMYISRVTRNVKVRGPSIAKTLGPRRFEYGNRGQYDS